MRKKWVVGNQISKEGSAINSPGLLKLIELKKVLEKSPRNFNLEKKMLNNIVIQKKPEFYMTLQTFPTFAQQYSQRELQTPQNVITKNEEIIKD